MTLYPGQSVRRAELDSHRLLVLTAAPPSAGLPRSAGCRSNPTELKAHTVGLLSELVGLEFRALRILAPFSSHRLLISFTSIARILLVYCLSCWCSRWDFPAGCGAGALHVFAPFESHGVTKSLDDKVSLLLIYCLSWICSRWDSNPHALTSLGPQPSVYTNSTTRARNFI